MNILILSLARNRFNLSRQTTEKNLLNDEGVSTTTTSRLLRPRPTFNLKSRGRPTGAAPGSASSSAATTVSPITPSEGDVSNADETTIENDATVGNSNAPVSGNLPTRTSSRLNLSRPNRLLTSRNNKNNNLNKNLDNKPSTSNNNDNKGSSNLNSFNNNDDTIEQNSEVAQNNLNRLKNRPRIQINAKAAADNNNKSKSNNLSQINRKANPLISRRKFGVSPSSTTLGE